MKKRVLTLIMALVLLLGSFTPALAAGVSSNNKKVQWLIDKGYVVGRAEQGLELDKTITRAEFAKMVVVIEGGQDKAKEKKGQKSKFSDVKEDHWANGYIVYATERGYIKGMDDGKFYPEKNISNQEVIAILDRLHPCFKEQETQGEDWAKYYISFAKASEILKDVDFKEAYKDSALREQAFEMVYNEYHSPKECKVVTVDGPIRKPSQPITDYSPTVPFTPIADTDYTDSWTNDPIIESPYVPEIPVTPETPVEIYTITYQVEQKFYAKQNVEKGNKATQPINPIKEGYKFLGWYNNGSLFDFSKGIYSNILLEAKFEKEITPVKKHTVTIDSKNGSPTETRFVEDGQVLGQLPNPTRPGYTFVEWQSNGQKYDPSKAVTQDLYLEALWIPINEKVIVSYKFESSDGTTLPSEVTRLLPAAHEETKGRNVTPVAPGQTSVSVADGTWTFVGYNPASVTGIGANQEFVGTWKFTPAPAIKVPTIAIVNTKLIAGDKSIKVSATDVLAGDVIKFLADGSEVATYTMPFDGATTTRTLTGEGPLVEGQKVVAIVERNGAEVARSAEIVVEAAPIVPTGDMTVDEAINNQGITGTVVGYIVGQPTSPTNVLTTATGDTAIAIADSPDETDPGKMLFVQVPAGFRPEFGLATNSSNMGRKISVTGSLEPYFTPHKGLKAPTEMKFLDTLPEKSFIELVSEIPKSVEILAITVQDELNKVKEMALAARAAYEKLSDEEKATPENQVALDALDTGLIDKENAILDAQTMIDMGI